MTTTGRFNRDYANDFDIDDPEFNEHYDEIQADLVERCPVARSNVGHGYWVINRYEDVRAAAQDWQTFSSAKGYMPNRPEGIPFLYPEESDPPYHSNWRRVLNPLFAPQFVSTYEGDIRAETNALIDQFIDAGECDFVPQFAAQLPGLVFFKAMMGVPVEMLPQLVQWMDDGIYHADPEVRAAGFANGMGYLGGYLAERAEQPPRGDVVDVIAKGVEKDGELCPFEDRVSIITDLVLGGIATTTYVMSGGVYHLATHPEDREVLVKDPTIIPQAVEEFVRIYSPIVALGRSATKDCVVAGTEIKAGDFVMLNYASASRDPSVVEKPRLLDIHRQESLHAAFGQGPHRCIGSHLARLELKVIFEELLRRIPSFEMAPGAEPLYQTGVLRMMRSLPIVFPAGGEA